MLSGCQSPSAPAEKPAVRKAIKPNSKPITSQIDVDTASASNESIAIEGIEGFDDSLPSDEMADNSDENWESEYPESEEYPDGEELSETAENLQVTQEKLVQIEIIPVRRPNYRNTSDSVLTQIEKRISIQGDAVSKRVIVEKWSSPVNFVGYKFNRKKLVIYGIGLKDAVRMYFYLNEYYLAINKELFVLDENFELVPLIEVHDEVISTYLLADENRL